MNKRFWHVKAQVVEPVRLELRSTYALKALAESIKKYPEDYSETTKLRCEKELAKRAQFTEAAEEVIKTHGVLLGQLAKESSDEQNS